MPPHPIADNCDTIVAVSITGIDRLKTQKTYTSCMSRTLTAGNATAPAAKGQRRTKDGDGPGRTSNGQTTRPRGRPFQIGNQLAKRRRQPLSEDELRRVLRSSMTKRGMRSIVKRLEAVVREGTGRDAVAASRLLLNLAGLTGVDEGVGGRPGPPGATTTVISMPTPPPR